MRLSELLSRIGIPARGMVGDAEVTGISADSRKARPGDLFVCMPSRTSDTHAFIPAAKKAGASAVIAHSASGLEDLPGAWFDPNGHEFISATGLLCREIFGDPTAKMNVIGVTGTNGKTTTTWMVRDALAAMGRRAVYLGTLGYHGINASIGLENTTPFPVELHEILAQAREENAQDFVMEASSHALFERRLAGIRFDVGVFTNLTQDHLDFHGSMEAYFEAKKLLFTEYAESSLKKFRGAINRSDSYGERLWQEVGGLGYGSPGADLSARIGRVTAISIEMTLTWQGSEVPVVVPVGGMFNVENALSAIATLLSLEYSIESTTEAMRSVKAVPGRFEAVANHRGFDVIVDYAHTPDALKKLLESARALSPKKIIAVFGCGGDRDRTKRPKMAAVTSALAEISVVTSDNPRTEDPNEIIAEVESGLLPGSHHLSIPDRREAIRKAVEIAEVGDIVVIAGKGHEDYQIIGRTKYPMDDREIAREALA